MPGPKYDPSLYDAAYFARRKRKGPGPLVQKAMRWTVAEFGPFGSSLDLGAGRGDWSRPLADMGVDAWAVDVSPEALAAMPEGLRKLRHDLREPLDLGRVFDLVICVEVAEHLPESAANILCQTIAKHCGGLAIFTAAPPGQGGTGHVNCQPEAYWKRKMTGLVYLPGETEKVKTGWESAFGAKFSYLPRNLMVFGR